MTESERQAKLDLLHSLPYNSPERTALCDELYPRGNQANTPGEYQTNPWGDWAIGALIGGIAGLFVGLVGRARK